MASPKYAGSPTGGGNPPGKHSPSYLSDPGEGESNFNRNPSYRGDMHIGMNKTATDVGNQPKSTSTKTIGSSAKGQALP